MVFLVVTLLVGVLPGLKPDIIFDVFEYGESYKHLNSPMKFITPQKLLTEVSKAR